MRTSTERPEGVAVGAAVLAGTSVSHILETAERLLTDRAAFERFPRPTPYGDGQAAPRIVARIRRYFDELSR